MLYAKASDPDLISALRSGKQEALTEIFRRHWKELYLTACCKLKSHELAEETVQDLFTELWDKRATLFNSDQEMNLGAYLGRAIKNKVLNHMRKLIYAQQYWQYCKSHVPRFENSAHELAEYNDLQQKLDAAVDQLSDKTREIFVLHKLKGVPVGKISQQMHLSEKAVGYHLTKSAKELRIHLKEFI